MLGEVIPHSLVLSHQFSEVEKHLAVESIIQWIMTDKQRKHCNCELDIIEFEYNKRVGAHLGFCHDKLFVVDSNETGDWWLPFDFFYGNLPDLYLHIIGMVVCFVCYHFDDPLAYFVSGFFIFDEVGFLSFDDVAYLFPELVSV